MLIVTTTLIRPSIDVPFHDVGAVWQAYMKETYIDTGKMTYADIGPNGQRGILSDDRLSLVLTSHWRSVEDNLAFLVDINADAFKSTRAAYSDENGIQVLLTRQVVFDELDLESDT